MNFKFATLCFVLCYLHVSSAVTFTITQDAAAIVESNVTTSWVFTVTRDSTSGPVDIGVSTISSGVYNSANLATDIVALNNVSLTFPDGVASETFNVSIVGDIIYEYNETFIITLEVGSSDTFTPFTVTILNDDPLPIVQAVGSGAEAAASITINFQMNRPSELICTANWRTTSGTALQNVDYVGKTGSQVFPAGTLLTQNTIVPVADTVDEVNEVVVLAANGASGNCTFAGGQVVIIDDDPASTIVNVTNSVIAGFEGSSAATAAVLQWTLNLSPVSGQYVNITYQVAGGTASYGTDYVAPAGPSGVFSIPPGASTASFWVKIIPDVFWETDETVLISIISISGGTWSTALPIVLNGTIRNDDAVPSMIVADVAWAEGNTAPTFRGIIIFTGTGWTQQNITVGYTLMDGTAEAGVDYQNVTSAVNIVGGNATAIIPFLGNTNSNAANRTFYFVITDISCPACAGLYTPTITKGTGIVTILDDDLPEVFVRGSSVTEAYGAVLSFTVSIQVNQTSDVVVYYSVTGGTATPGLDFVAVTGNVTISAGLFSAVVNISVLNDTVSEPTETVFLTVTSVTGPGTAGNNGTGYILDSPSTPLPVVYTYNITVIEGDSGNTTGFVPVSLSFSSSRIVNITYSTRDESAYTPSDYYTVDGWIAFYPGETQKNISVLIVADTKEEAEKSFIVRLNSVSNASFGNYTAGVLISDDDALVSVAVQSDVYEGSPAFNPRFIGLIVVIGVVVIAIIASIVGFFALKRYVS